MGGKSDLANREDRPESGGTDRDDIRSNSGMQELDKQAFAEDMAAKRAGQNEPNPAKRAE